MTTKPLSKMESKPHRTPTYFVYEQVEESYGEIVGPVFPEEIDDIMNEVFAHTKAKIDQECVFKAFHYTKYKQTFKDFWYDFVSRLIDSLDIPVDYELDTADSLGLTEDFDFYEEAAKEEWNGDFDITEDIESILNLDSDTDEDYVAEDFAIVSQHFTINKDIKGADKLHIFFSIDFSPYWIAVLTKELTLYLDGIFELEIGEPFYMARNGDVVVGIEEAYRARIKDTTEIIMN